MAQWRNAARTMRWKIAPFINGESVASKSLDQYPLLNPSTEIPLCGAPSGDRADVDAAVQVSRERFKEGCWSGLSPRDRARALCRLSDLILRDKSEIALLDTLEVGKPITSALDDVQRAARLLVDWASFAEKLVGHSGGIASDGISLNTFEPRGVVGAITPWNFPVVNAVVKFAPALFVGNSVVLKPSELSPGSALKLAELAIEAGIPRGVLNVVPGLGTTVGAALAGHPDVDLISFTGSTQTGRKIMELSGRSNGKPLLLECGGKSPHVVFDDVKNLDGVAAAVVQGMVRNQGQVCSAHTRLVVHASIKRALIEKVIVSARLIKPADPLEEGTSFGPLASPGQRDRIKRYVLDGIESGAIPVLRGDIQERGGCYVSPTVFDSVRSDMRIWREEIFGPVLCVKEFETESEALSLANDSEYGLVGTVWTRDIGRGLRAAHALKVGAVSVRTSEEAGSNGPPVLSFEPQKASGFGSEIGIRGLQSYSTLKWITFSGG